MCHGNSLYILLLIIFAPLFIFLFIRLVSVQSCIPRRAALDQLRGIFDIIQAGRSFIQVKFIIHVDLTDDDVTGISSLQRNKMINGCQGDPADAGIKNIVAPYDRNILRNVYPISCSASMAPMAIMSFCPAIAVNFCPSWRSSMVSS